MLSRENNELLTRVGPGTPMGEFLRRYWMPALLADEIPEPDGDVVRLRLLGEDFLCFRATDGRVGVVEPQCAHRGADLTFARNEECGLRCIFHGWKYDVDGNCVDMPSEPDGGAILMKEVKLRALRTALRGGVLWVYMGPMEFAAEPPDFEWAVLPARQRTAIKRLVECNWVQAVEGGIDSSHISYLHGRTEKQRKSDDPRDVAPGLWGVDRHPVFEVKHTRYGMLVGARRDTGDGRYYWRITQFLLPFYTMVPPRSVAEDSKGTFYWGHAWVPIDDENCWAWSFSANPWHEYSDQEIAWNGGRDGFWGPLDGDYRPVRNRDNNYQFSRERQRTVNFAGIEGFGDQDSAVQESMGRIADRTREYLGHSDKAIVAFRHLMLGLAKDMTEGKSPECARHGDWFGVRSASVILRPDQPFDEAAAWLLNVERRAAAE